jgi:hypothetical protein
MTNYATLTYLGRQLERDADRQTIM